MAEAPYQRIRKDLEERIREGFYKPNTRLPSDSELARMYGVSRMTIRNSVDGLVAAGLVVRRHGVGTFVASNPRRGLNELRSFSEDMAAEGRTTRSIVQVREAVEAESRVRDALDLAEGTLVAHLERVRIVDDVPFAVHRVWIPLTRCPELVSAETECDSLYAFLEARGITITRAQQEITAVSAEKWHSDSIKVEVGAPLIHTRRLTFDQAGVAFEYAEMWSRPDIPLTVDLYRNRKL